MFRVRQNLAIQQEQNKLAFEREAIEIRIAKANAVAKIAQTQEDIAIAKADPKTKPEQPEALNLKFNLGNIYFFLNTIDQSLPRVLLLNMIVSALATDILWETILYLCWLIWIVQSRAKTMTDIKELHDQDFNLWVEATKKAIADRDFENMDWDNLFDEVDDMGKSEKRSLESYLERLIAHILKLQYWDSERERNYKHWKVEVINFRQRLKRLLKQNPSFNRLLAEIYPEIFQNAVNAWRVEFEIPADTCFIELEQMLKDDFFGF